MKRYHFQIDQGVSVDIDKAGQAFPSDEIAFRAAAQMAGKLLAELISNASDRDIELRIETSQHVRLGTVKASLKRDR